MVNRRHTLEVTADRLSDLHGDYNDRLRNYDGGVTLDEISHVAFVLREIADDIREGGV